MKALRISIIVSLLVASFAFFPAAPSASADCISLSGNGTTSAVIGPFSMDSGSFVSVTMTAVDGDGTAVNLFVDGAWVTDSVKYTATHTFTYTFPDQSDNIMLILDWQFPGLPQNTYTVTTSDCGVLPMIPAQAVSGTFVAQAEIYWAPGELIAPLTYVDLGKNYLVAGQDETGMYRKVLIACTWVWVRAETVGPNFDEVWHGTPLPTTIVDVEPSNACPGVQSPVNVPVEEGRLPQ